MKQVWSWMCRQRRSLASLAAVALIFCGGVLAIPVRAADYSLADGNREDARRTMHTVKGLAASLGMTRLHEAAMDLETDLRANSSRADMAGFAAALDYTVSACRRALAATGRDPA